MPIPSYRPDNPDTYLSSVNSVLAAIGQAPVETIDQDNPELMMILQIVMETTKDTQAEGWVFNTENHYPMEPDAEGYIEIKEHVLRLDISEGQTWRTSDVVRRPKPQTDASPDPVALAAEIAEFTSSCTGCDEPDDVTTFGTVNCGKDLSQSGGKNCKYSGDTYWQDDYNANFEFSGTTVRDNGKFRHPKSNEQRGKLKTSGFKPDGKGCWNTYQLCEKDDGGDGGGGGPSPEPTPDGVTKITGPQSTCPKDGKNITLTADTQRCPGKTNGRWAIMKEDVYRNLQVGERGVSKLTDTELVFDSGEMAKFVDMCETGEWRFRHLVDCDNEQNLRGNHIINLENGCCDDTPVVPGEVELNVTCPTNVDGIIKVIVKGANGGKGRWFKNEIAIGSKEDINEDRFKSELQPDEAGTYFYIVDFDGKQHKSKECVVSGLPVPPPTPEPTPEPEPEPCPDDLNVPISPECDSDGVPDPSPWPDSETKPTVVLYDKMHHTFFFGCCVLCDVVWLLPFPALPPAFQRYITSRASVRAAAQLVNNPQLFQLLQQQEATARAACMEYETTQGDYSFMGFPDGTVYQTYQPWQTLDRNY